MPGAQSPVADKMRVAIRFDERGESPRDFLNKIQPVYILNDEPAPFASGGFVNRVTTGGLGITRREQIVVMKKLTSGAVAANTDTGALYTVTAGKTLYVTHISVTTDTAGGGNVTVGDGDSTVAANIRHFDMFATPNVFSHTVLPTPISFTTAVHANHGEVGNSTVRVTIYGWEE